MKNYIKLLLSLLIYSGALGQTVTFPAPETIVTKSELRATNARIDSLNKALSNGVVFPPPVAVVPDCKHGPDIKNVYGVTKTELTLLFDADSVTAIQWKISNMGDTASVARGVFAPTMNHPTIKFGKSLTAKPYRLWIDGVTCKNKKGVVPYTFTVPGSTGVVDPPVIVVPPIEGPGAPSFGFNLGAYEEKAGGRTYTRSGSPKLALKFNSDGTFSDNTPGLSVGDQTTYEGKISYYMINYGHFHSNKTYKNLQNVYVPDQVITVRRFDCDSSRIQNYDQFKEKLHGYPKSHGVNRYTSQVSEVTVTIRTDDSPGIPEWVKVSRALNFQPNIPDRAFDRKIFAIESINHLDKASDYHAKGVYTSNNFNGPAPNSFRTYKFPRDLAIGAPKFSDDELYHFLRGHINQWGLLPRSVITDEVPENAQGLDGSIYSRMALSYKGALELFQEKFPGTKKRDTNLFGSYGVDQYTGYLSKEAIQMPRAELIKWIGSHDTDYFRSNHYKYRNVNADYYMYNSVRMIPYELLLTNERVKVSTKTMPGGDWESDWIVFGTTLCQSLVKDDATGIPMGVEENHSGEIISYRNGDILRYPSANSMIGEHYDLGFWSTLIGKGIVLWGPGSFGTDQSKVSYYTPDGWPTVKGWPIKWRLNGQSNWDDWMPSRNGAPENDKNGLQDNLYATVIDVTMWGRQDALKLVDGYADNIYYASYTSSRKSFTAIPGIAGYHLNGFGPLNLNFVPFKDAYDQEGGVSLFTTGPKGNGAVYYNGFLSADEYEDDVTITHNGMSKNIGRVYGRKTAWVKF